MKYLLLLTVPGPIDEVPDAEAADARAMMERYAALRLELEDEGVWCGGEALHPASTATGVRRVDDTIVVNDGPFVETSDALVGYYLVDCDDLDHAVRVASRVPVLDTGGTIEVRPVWDYEALM